MYRRVEDQKEVAPCGMLVRYTVDRDTDFITYTDICNRGQYRLSQSCKRCSWRGICKPTEANFLEILSEALGREVKPLEVIAQLFERKDERQS